MRRAASEVCRRVRKRPLQDLCVHTEAAHCCGGSEGAPALPIGARCSSFLANSLQEKVTEHGIDRIVNGSKHGSPSAGLVDLPTLDLADDFCYDIDLRQKPTGKYQGFNGHLMPDPFELVQGDINTLSGSIRDLLGTDHPVLSAAAKYFFEIDGGKKIRPTMVLLMSYALNQHHGALPAASGGSPGSVSLAQLGEFDLACQRRLAEITEMIHTASLFHDDVIDKADTRRGVPSVNKIFGNKLAILAGDFLLARASVSLARLRNVETVELLSSVIEHLVKGEVLQMRPLVNGVGAFEYYVRKNYYKTGSLMANSCRAAAILGKQGKQAQDVAHEYGKRVGLAFQLVDDVLDFEGNDFTLGKPALNDLKQGLATAPVLLAAEEAPHLQQLIARKFNAPGDVDEALAAVKASHGIQRTKDIAWVQAELAMDAVMKLDASPERDALVHLAYKIVHRNH